MQHLEGSGTPVLYIGRTVLKGYIMGSPATEPYLNLADSSPLDILLLKDSF